MWMGWAHQILGLIAVNFAACYKSLPYGKIQRAGADYVFWNEEFLQLMYKEVKAFWLSVVQSDTCQILVIWRIQMTIDVTNWSQCTDFCRCCKVICELLIIF